MTAETVAPQLEINIGDLKPVMIWYTIVAIPAPNKQELIGVPQIFAINTVATNTASTCCNAYNAHSLKVLGLSEIP